MALIKYVRGNFSSPKSYIPKYDSIDNRKVLLCHQTNTAGILSTRVARSIASKYPEVGTKYKEACANNDILGLYQVLKTRESGLYVVNMFAQKDYGKSIKHTNYEALYTILNNISDKISDPNIILCFPKGMGAGPAGGSWTIVENMIKEAFECNQNTIYIVEYM